MRVSLSSKEWEILQKAIKNCELGASYKISSLELNEYLLESSEDEIIDLRECCSDYLLVVGFNKDYKPTEEGAILERLIDKLYPG